MFSLCNHPVTPSRTDPFAGVTDVGLLVTVRRDDVVQVLVFAGEGGGAEVTARDALHLVNSHQQQLAVVRLRVRLDCQPDRDPGYMRRTNRKCRTG